MTSNPEVIVSFGRVGQIDDPAALQRPLRVREAISSTKFEVTNRPGAARHSRREYLTDEKSLDTTPEVNHVWLTSPNRYELDERSTEGTEKRS